jgi:putative NADPH-quinone reductase
MARIVLVQGHPDNDPARFCRALADAYRDGAVKAGHSVFILDVAALTFDPLRSRADWESSTPPVAIVQAQKVVEGADHLVFIFPLWLGTLPALLKAFLEQVMRPGFAFTPSKGGLRGRLKRRSSRMIVTMGMPAWLYRLWFCSHGIASFRRGILAFVGFRPNRVSLIGSIETMDEQQRLAWLRYVNNLGRKAR